jgi:folate-binding protein YgfZ
VSGPTVDEALVEDYAALRTGYGALHLARGAVVVSGPEAADYLQGQCSQDLAPLAVGGAVDSLLLEPDGKLCALLRVVRTGADRFVLDTDAGFEPAVAARLARFRLRSKVDIEPVPAGEWACIGLRGSAAPDPGPQADGTWAVPYRWNGVVGYDLVGAAAEDAVGGAPRWCGPAAAEALRVEAGIPVMGRELDAKTIAPEATGLVERTVSFTKGCYTGQELIARLDARGNRVARRLCGLLLADPEVDVVAHRLVGTEVRSTEGRGVGQVTSAAWCAGLGRFGALAYLHRSMEVPNQVRVVVDGNGSEGLDLMAEARAVPMVG